jgi:hypothetical protein
VVSEVEVEVVFGNGWGSWRAELVFQVLEIFVKNYVETFGTARFYFKYFFL